LQYRLLEQAPVTEKALQLELDQVTEQLKSFPLACPLTPHMRLRLEATVR
jgi:hypothetical protein